MVVTPPYADGVPVPTCLEISVLFSLGFPLLWCCTPCDKQSSVLRTVIYRNGLNAADSFEAMHSFIFSDSLKRQDLFSAIT